MPGRRVNNCPLRPKTAMLTELRSIAPQNSGYMNHHEDHKADHPCHDLEAEEGEWPDRYDASNADHLEIEGKATSSVQVSNVDGTGS